MTKHQLRLWLRVWHRRFGIVLAILVLLVSVTGILINHADRWQLVQRPVQSSLLLNLYGIELPEPVSYLVKGQWLSQVSGNQLFVNKKAVGPCQGKFAGALTLEDARMVAACGDELLHLTGDGEIIERLGAVYALPSPIDRLGTCDNRPCLESGGRKYLLDLENLRWNQIDSSEFVAVAATTAPVDLDAAIAAQFTATGLDWERVLLDLHSGRLFGLGPWLMDLLAVGLILIAISGLTIWLMSGKPGVPAQPHRKKIKRRAD